MESGFNAESPEEKKRRERAEFENFFIQEKMREEARNKKIITLVIIFGVGVPLVFSIIYVIAMVALGAFG
ncbi:MAG: hypothetical protein MH137_07725 [Flavobacteriales bacterium]|nr:hypothetical protein [Flavobacteriales bacterium]